MKRFGKEGEKRASFLSINVCAINSTLRKEMEIVTVCGEKKNKMYYMHSLC